MAISGVPNSLNSSVILVVYTQFTNVAVGRIIHPAGPRVADPWCMVQNLKFNLFRVSP